MFVRFSIVKVVFCYFLFKSFFKVICELTWGNITIGGRLLVGVGDDCIVYGVSCTRKQEDQTRCQIDHVIQNFYPHVLPHLYTVKFIPVKLAFDESIELHKNDPLLKVLEVSVIRQDLPKNLYVNDKDEIYIRRDGSVEGPLKAPQIVEWCKSNYSYKYNEDDPMDTEFNGDKCRQTETNGDNGDKLPHAETYEKLREGLIKLRKSTERQIKYLQQSYEIENEIYKRKKLKAKDDTVSSKANQLHPNSQSSCTLL